MLATTSSLSLFSSRIWNLEPSITFTQDQQRMLCHPAAVMLTHAHPYYRAFFFALYDVLLLKGNPLVLWSNL